ncbi:hypothetical protein ACTFIV_003215 [Dictyostelium citrinum]
MRVIDLTGVGLSPAVLRRLQENAENREDIQFHFSQEADEEYMIDCETIPSALEFWQEEAKLSLDLEDLYDRLHQHLTQVQDHENLLQFLIRLTGTADAYNVATKVPLARRVLQMIQLMAQDRGICSQFVYLIHQGLSSCDDRVMADLRHFKLLSQTSRAFTPIDHS